MTEPTRGARARRGNRRPGSLLLTALLVLAIVASSALVFTDRVVLLKLAVIISLWAAVVAAFISFIYRRQADVDAAKSRDLKLVYDLQLDREISARHEYELSVEAQLRRELAAELRAQASDEVASLRAELAALRANLEIIFDADLQHRPAIETDRSAVHTFGEWGGLAQGAAAPERGDLGMGPGRVVSSRIDTEAREDQDPNTDESPIIDVPVEPHPSEGEWVPQVPGGAHRRPSERETSDAGWRPPAPEPPPRPPQPPAGGRRRTPEPMPAPQHASPTPEIRFPWLPPEPTAQPQPQSAPPRPPPQRQEPERVAGRAPSASDWRPAPAEGEFIPAGAPGSNWTAAPERNGASAAADDRSETPLVAPPGHARHSAPAQADPAWQPQPVQETPSARHRGATESTEPAGQHTGGQPVSELMARLQAGSTGGGRRRRRDE